MNEFLSQTKFAEYIGTSRKTVTTMKQKKQIIMVDKKVNVSESIKLLTSLGRRFDKDHKLIVSNTSKKTMSEPTSHLLNTDFVYPSLSETKNTNTDYPMEIMKEVASSEKIDLPMDKILTKEIDALKPFEVTKIKGFWQGMQERFKYDVLVDKYILKTDVYDEQFNIARSVREAMIGLPNRISHQLLGQTDIHIITRILDKEINKILEGLSK